MRTNMSRFTATASAFVLTMALATPVMAQSGGAPIPGEPQGAPTQDPAAQGAAEEGDTTVVVTGSRVRRDTFSVAEPLTVITSQEITQQGFSSSTDALQSAAVTAGAGQINNSFGGFVTDGGTGANTLGLRGLGPARTLVLLNGRRLAPGGTRGSLVAADLNVLPTAIVERIEILKAGASSIYGSDAIAGVVNIITDQRLNGLSIQAQTNVPEVGEGIENRIAASFGFQANRLSVIGSVEYRNRETLSRNQAEFTRCPIVGNLSGVGTEIGSGDPINPATGQPYCFPLDNGGVTINTLGLPTRQALGRSGTIGNFNRFAAAPEVTTGPFPGFLGVTTINRDTLPNGQEEEPLITPAEIYTGFLAATYELNMLGNAEVYGELLATRRNSSAPLYRQLSLDYVQGSPLLPANLRNGLFALPQPTTGGRNVAARAFIGYGLTQSEQEVDFVRASGGVRGDFFFEGWRYDAFAGKSWTDGRYEIESFLTDRLSFATDVVQNADGTFRCATSALNPQCVAAPALSADVINGILPQAFRDYITENTIGNTKFRETTFAFGVDGPLFRAPGGDALLALGAEYRSQRIDDTPDQNAINGNLLGLTASLPTRGSDSVREVFGELFVPVLADRPFFYRLNFTGSLRYTDYESYGGDFTYKVAGEWEPVRGLGFRGSYGTSYRAPALSEQFLGATSGFLAASTDPCDELPPAGQRSPLEQITATNCASIGIPEGFLQTSGVTTFTAGGAESGLEAETSTNWTVGVVARPPLPGGFGTLALALDYFDIKVENGVQSLAPATVLNRCYQSPNFNPAEGFCQFVTRDANQALTVFSRFINLSEDIVRGFEFSARYSNEILGGRFVLNANVTKYEEQSTRLFPEEFLTDANGIVTQPDWVGTFDASYARDNYTIRYGVDWIDGDADRTYEFFAFDNLTGITDPELVQSFREDFSFITENYFLHNASVQFDVTEKMELTVGVRNLFDTQPPRITALGFNTIGNAPLYSGYDYRGRTFFANVTFGF